MRVKKGDKVVVIAGRDKGSVGKVIRAFPQDEKVLVEGVNRITKHSRPTRTARGREGGGIIHKEAPIHVSNVQLAVEVDVDGEKKTVGTRVGYRFDEDGNKVRYAKRTGEDI
ncbi:50S ribosomal protein L24 [Actinobacteria bacterium YIM 96077]|uniref:Large ribosomal subunit protein uL24 n=1 Tax=Phytoactinopolyspora halophila TaxID=1981511 RepID=A0A329QBB5_9ACTN|nr:50S ribosomal protein L24 [Phytoactinopolyspora halophila]AYY14735.1 50S ribosomal protein L24 [Actinobacteria bacterium YIM 96077]RAW09646.1 50S ribosomal protein L24 [Phytoactinopolyspora halophila]